MPAFATIKGHVSTLWPALCSLLGAVLLVGAWKMTATLQYSDARMMAALFLWVFLPLSVAGIYARPALSSSQTLYFLLIFLSFAAFTLAFRNNYYRHIVTQVLGMAGAGLLLAGLPAWKWAHPWLVRLYRLMQKQEHIPSHIFPAIFFALFVASSVGISWYCFDFAPGYTDSTSQYVHSKFIASGHLYYIPGHPMPDFFPVWLMVHGNRWYSQYPPLHQTLLGIFQFIHAPWLVNPLEGAATLLASYGIARRAYGETTARIAGVLVWFSTFILFMSSEFMNHASALLFTTLMIYAYGELLPAIEGGEKKRIRSWAMAAGLASGGVFLTRPLVAVGVSLPFALHALWHLYKDRKMYLYPCMVIALSIAFCVALQLWYNHETTGEWFTYAYARYHTNSLASAMGYNKDGSFSATISKMREEWYLLDFSLFEWSLPCLWFVLVSLLTPGKNLMTKLLFGVLVSQTLVNMLNQFHNTIFGPRYMYETATALVILTAAGMARLPQLMAALPSRIQTTEGICGMAVLCAILICASGVGVRVPEKVGEFTHFMDSHPQFYHDMIAGTEHPALIFMSRIPPEQPPPDPVASFRWTAWTNPPDPDAPVIFALDRGDARNRALIDYYPNRKAYVESKGKLTAVDGTPVKPATQP